MNKEELKETLKELAEKDLAEGSSIDDHPCTIAIKAIDKCFDDIKDLQSIVNGRINARSKKYHNLVGLNYNPEW